MFVLVSAESNLKMLGTTSILFVLLRLSSASHMEVSTEPFMDMDESDTDGDDALRQIQDLLTDNYTEFVDVQDYVLNVTASINFTLTNETLGNETTMAPKSSLNSAECRPYMVDPYWRLTASVEDIRKFMCACYRVCFTRQQLDTVRKFVQHNETKKSVFERRGSPLFNTLFAFYLVMIFVGTLANVAVIVGITGLMKDKTVVNRFVVSLAVADLFMSMLITPVKMFYLIELMEELKETWACKIILYLRQIAQAETIMILTIIAFERYYAICHPLKAKFRCSMKRCHILVVVSWVLSLIIALPTVISAIYQTDRGQGATCVLYYTNPRMLHFHYLYFIVILLIIPTAVMSYTYGRICYVLWSSAKKAAELSNQNGNSQKDRAPELQARVKVIKTMVGLMIVFLLCWGPRLCVNVISVYFLDILPAIRYYADLFAEILALSHSAINPIMFIALSKPLRDAYIKSLPAWCCCQRMKRSTSRPSSLGSGQTLSSTDEQSKTKEASVSSNLNHI